MRNFNVTVEGKTYQVQVEEVGAGASAAAVPVQQAAPVSAPKVAAPTGGTNLTSPMPGMVLSFKVENGAQVKENQVVMTLEAMKMENDIVAPCAGTITFVSTKGASVNTGDVLAVIR